MFTLLFAFRKSKLYRKQFGVFGLRLSLLCNPGNNSYAKRNPASSSLAGFYFAPTNQIRWSSGVSEVPMPFSVLPSVQKTLFYATRASVILSQLTDCCNFLSHRATHVSLRRTIALRFLLSATIPQRDLLETSRSWYRLLGLHEPV